MLQYLTEETLRGLFVFTLLNQNVDDVIVLVNSTPKLTAFPLDRDDHRLIHKPRVPQSPLVFAKLVGIVRTELHAPLSNGFIRNDDPSLSQQIFDVSKAQREKLSVNRWYSHTAWPMISGWEAITTIA